MYPLSDTKVLKFLETTVVVYLNIFSLICFSVHDGFMQLCKNLPNFKTAE